LEAIAGNTVVVLVVDVVVLDLLPATWLPPSPKVKIVEPFENPKFCVQMATHATVNLKRTIVIVEVKSLLVFAVCIAIGDDGFEQFLYGELVHYIGVDNSSKWHIATMWLMLLEEYDLHYL
jgi:hypothetical protein